MNADTILGISPGTRFIGFAILRDGRLIHAQVRAFHGKWSKSKRNNILKAIDGSLMQHGVTSITVKLPDVLPISRSFHEVIGSLNTLCERKNLKPRYYSLSEIKRKHYGDTKCNVDSLMALVVAAYPELMVEYRKEKTNRNAYYYKLFEAVSVGMM